MFLTLRLIKVPLIKTVGIGRGQINQQNRKPKNRPILIHSFDFDEGTKAICVGYKNAPFKSPAGESTVD